MTEAEKSANRREMSVWKHEKLMEKVKKNKPVIQSIFPQIEDTKDFIPYRESSNLAPIHFW